MMTVAARTSTCIPPESRSSVTDVLRCSCRFLRLMGAGKAPNATAAKPAEKKKGLFGGLGNVANSTQAAASVEDQFNQVWQRPCTLHADKLLIPNAPVAGARNEGRDQGYGLGVHRTAQKKSVVRQQKVLLNNSGFRPRTPRTPCGAAHSS